MINMRPFAPICYQIPISKISTRTSRIPTGRLLDDMGAYVLSGDSMKATNTDIKFVSVDYDFVPTYGIPMAAGRNFSREYGTDTLGFVLNESAVKSIGWKSPGEAVGKDFKYGNTKGHVIGVIKDFHFESMHQPIVPIVLVMFPPSASYFNNLSVKFSGNNLAASLSYLENTWKKFLPEIPYQYAFLDENFDKLYEAEQRQGNIFTIFACIAIFIACLGLFGLSAFTITQRVKEIGIRKVLGADVSTIVTLAFKRLFETGCYFCAHCMRLWLGTLCINGCRILLIALVCPGGSLSWQELLLRS